MSSDNVAADIKGKLTDELNRRNITVMWLPDLSTKRKFPFNTNIRHEDEMGRDLDIKSIDQLCGELQHCGDELVLLFHDITEGPHKGCQMIFYDSWD